MRKIVLLIGAAVLFSVSLSAQQQDAKLPRLAVVEFSTNVSTDKTKADAITVRNLVESQMVATGKYEIITRDDIDKLLENQKIQVSAISSAENLKKLELANINYIVTGSLDAMDNDYAITVRVLDVSSGRFSHSDNDFMGSASRDLYTGITELMAKFTAGMSATDGGAIVQGSIQTAPVSTGIAIEVNTKLGGTLYFQGEEIASLWDNDSHSIPIEKQGTYTVKMVFSDGTTDNRSVVISARGTVKVEFASYKIGDKGPGGGIIFFMENGRYMECSGELGSYNWSAAMNAAKNYRGGGFSDWRLPTKEELDLMYKNLKQKGLGGFSNDWYWSSSQNDNGDAWAQYFSVGGQDYDHKNNTFRVRAIRAFNP